MIKINGILWQTRLKRVVPIIFACRKPRRKPSIFSSLGNLLLIDLIVLITVHLWVPLGHPCLLGFQIFLCNYLWKAFFILPSGSQSPLLWTGLLGLLLLCMDLVGNLPKSLLCNGSLISRLRMRTSGCLWGTLIFIDMLKIEIKLGGILMTLLCSTSWATLGSLNFQLRVERTLGAIWKTNLHWSRLIGSSLPQLGLPNSLYPWSFLLLKPLLITYHARSR